jgi:AraC-like DNA-binding protein
MLYPGPDLVQEYASDIFGSASVPTFHRPVVEDLRLFSLLSRLHGCSSELARDSLELEELCIAIVEQAFRAHAGQAAPKKEARHATALRQIHDLLSDRHQEAPALDELAGMSKFALLRQFRSLYGLSPHAFLRLRRVRYARDAVLKGAGLADAAASAGFADQAHMTRSFRRMLGFTPGALVRASHTERERTARQR